MDCVAGHDGAANQIVACESANCQTDEHYLHRGRRMNPREVEPFFEKACAHLKTMYR